MIKKNDVLKSKMSSQGKVPHEVQIIETESDNIYFRSLDNGSVYCLTLSELERDYVIPKEEWSPKVKEIYWFIDEFGSIVNRKYIDINHNIQNLYLFGVYPSQELAEQALAEIKEKIKNNI